MLANRWYRITKEDSSKSLYIYNSRIFKPYVWSMETRDSTIQGYRAAISRVIKLMPQSHCAESTPEWGRIDNSSLFGWSFLVIPGHSSNDNDNQFEQCSSRPCRWVQKFWICSKGLCTQQCPAWILFIRGYAHWKRVVIFFVAQLTCCILVILTVFLVVLIVYYIIRTDSETAADQKTVQTKTN